MEQVPEGDFQPNKYHKYFIGFPIPYINYSIIEEWLNDEKLTEEQAKDMLRNFPIMGFARHYSSVLTDEILMMLSADFYWHEVDWEKHKEMVKLYEETLGKKYK